MRPDEGFAFDPTSDAPLYLQLADQIERQVAGGSLAHGDRLPAVRRLARRLGVSTATVERAYADAGRRGALEARSGCGTFVAGECQNTVARLKMLEPALRQLATEVKQSALPTADALAMLRKQFEEGNAP